MSAKIWLNISFWRIYGLDLLNFGTTLAYAIGNIPYTLQLIELFNLLPKLFVLKSAAYTKMNLLLICWLWEDMNKSHKDNGIFPFWNHLTLYWVENSYSILMRSHMPINTYGISLNGGPDITVFGIWRLWKCIGQSYSYLVSNKIKAKYYKIF